MDGIELEDFDDKISSTAETLIPEPASVEFTGKRGPLFKLALKNAFFTILTLGIYRFWAKTWVRRYFWHNTRIRGEALEYTGLPSELLIGFLIALAILVPAFGVYQGLAFLIQGSSEVPAVLLDIIFYASLWAFFQYAFYRMWRYRLSRTAWRGIHFGLDGSAVKYTALSMGWTIITILTLGLAAPWARVSLWKFRIKNTRFGNTNFGFEGSGKNLLLKWLLVWSTPIITIGVIGYFHIDALLMFYSATSTPNDVDAEQAAAMAEQFKILTGAGAIGATVLVLTFPFIFIWYRVQEARYLIRATYLEEGKFAANIKSASIFWAYFLFLLALIAVAIGISIISTMVIFTAASATNMFANFNDINDVEKILTSAGGVMFTGQAVFGLLTYAIISALSMVMIRHRITNHIVSVVEIENSDVFDRVTQSAEQGPQHGEGFADALDVGAI